MKVYHLLEYIAKMELTEDSEIYIADLRDYTRGVVDFFIEDNGDLPGDSLFLRIADDF